MACRLLLMLVVLPIILTFTGPVVVAQTTATEGVVTEVYTEEVTSAVETEGYTVEVTTVYTVEVTTDEPDPCSAHPCSDPNTKCVADGLSYTCECQSGFMRESAKDNCTAIQQFTGEMTLTTIGGSVATYSPALADPTTTEFQNLATSVETAVDTIYEASTLASVYQGCHVLGFSSGSIVVNYTILFAQEDTSGTSVSINSTSVTSAFTTSLAAQVSAGTIDVVIDESTVSFSDFDECLSADDNNCDASATCTNLVGSFSCQCPELYTDAMPSHPGRVCTAPPPNLACDSNPCTKWKQECFPEGLSGYTCKCEEGYEETQYEDCDPVGRETEFRCFTCQDSIDNVKCNGLLESENGTAEWCQNPTDTCFNTIMMNPEGDGFMIRKGCMDMEDCYDILYSHQADPTKTSCFDYIFPYGGDTPPGPGVECHYCCSEYFPLDMCNYDSVHFLYGLPRINSWDPKMNWDYTMDYTTDPPPQSAAVRPLPFGVLGLLVTLMMAYILH